jgi:hypothetical protein
VTSAPEKSKELQALFDELTKLSKAQSAALQQAAYFRMTKNEADEFDARAKRIGELCALTTDFKPRQQGEKVLVHKRNMREVAVYRLENITDVE